MCLWPHKQWEGRSTPSSAGFASQKWGNTHRDDPRMSKKTCSLVAGVWFCIYKEEPTVWRMQPTDWISVGLPVHRWKDAGCVQRWGVFLGCTHAPRNHTDAGFFLDSYFQRRSFKLQEWRRRTSQRTRTAWKPRAAANRRATSSAPSSRSWVIRTWARSSSTPASCVEKKEAEISQPESCDHAFGSSISQTVCKSWRIKVFQKTNGFFGSAMLKFEPTLISPAGLKL